MKKSSARSASSGLLGEYLKTKREKAGLTQKQVADQLGYSTPQFISSWERAEREPPMNAVWKLSSIYKIQAEKLLDVILTYRHKMLEQDLRAEFAAARPKNSRAR